MHLAICTHGIRTGLVRDCTSDSGENLGNFCFSEVALESLMLWYKLNILLIAHTGKNFKEKLNIFICGVRFMGKLRSAC